MLWFDAADGGPGLAGGGPPHTCARDGRLARGVPAPPGAGGGGVGGPRDAPPPGAAGEEIPCGAPPHLLVGVDGNSRGGGRARCDPSPGLQFKHHCTF